MAEAPNGWFTRDLVFFGESLSPATVLARGARLEIPDLKSADPGTRDAYYSGLGSWLNTLGTDEAVQFQWRVDADYEQELESLPPKSAEAVSVSRAMLAPWASA